MGLLELSVEKNYHGPVSFSATETVKIKLFITVKNRTRQNVKIESKILLSSLKSTVTRIG